MLPVMHKRPVLFFLFLFTGCGLLYAQNTPGGFIQPVSIKYSPAPDLRHARLKKVLADNDNRLFVLSDAGVLRVQGTELVKDRYYRPLSGKLPADITIQETTGALYYLYSDRFLSNTEAGMPYGILPANRYDALAVSKNGAVFLTGPGGAALYRNGVLTPLTLPGETLHTPRVHKGVFYALGGGSVYRVKNDRPEKLHAADRALTAITFYDNELGLGTPDGYYMLDAGTGRVIMPLQTRVPVTGIQCLLKTQDGIWSGTAAGAFCKKNNARDYRYFASRRWLDNDSIVDLTTDRNGDLFLLSPTGLNQVHYQPTTYAGKAAYFENKIRQRHIRYGLLAELRMPVAGDAGTAEMADTDNDGLWTAFYLGSQAFRYAVTKEAKARQNAWESFTAFERLLSVNPLAGFPARTFERKGFKVSDPEAWRPSQDTGWEWKGTTSSDEFVGYIFVAALMDQYVARTKDEKKKVAGFIDAILMHIIRNNYNFVDANGRPTLWGRWHPDYVNSYAPTISDRKLGSVDIIAGLQLGYALTGKALYKTEALRLMKDHGYLDNIMISPYNIKATPGVMYEGIDMGSGPWNHSDDEMEFLSFWPLYHHALDVSLQKKYTKAINEYYQIEAPEKNPVWNLITLGTTGTFDRAAVLWYLREFPMDLVRWDIKNAHRKDLDFIDPGFRMQFTREVISPAERPAHRFNSNEFILDGGDGGRSELTGAEYLLAYWMGRYLKVIP